MRRSARGTAAGRLRFPGRARPSQDRRRSARDFAVDAGTGLSALRAAHSLAFDRAVSQRSGTGKADHRISDSARVAALFASGGRHSLQVPHLLRHHAVAGIDRRGGMENAGSPAAAHPQRAGSDERAAPGTPLFRRRHVRQAGTGYAAPVPECGKQRVLSALRTAGEQLPADHGARPDAGVEKAAADTARVDAAAGRLRRERSAAALSASVVHRVPAAAGIFRVPAEVSLLRSGRLSERSRRPVSAAPSKC